MHSNSVKKNRRILVSRGRIQRLDLKLSSPKHQQQRVVCSADHSVFLLSLTLQEAVRHALSLIILLNTNSQFYFRLVTTLPFRCIQPSTRTLSRVRHCFFHLTFSKLDTEMAFGQLGQENLKFQGSLGCVRLCLTQNVLFHLLVMAPVFRILAVPCH